MPPYAYCLPRYAKMDETYRNAPDNISAGKKGFISRSLSGAGGVFEIPPAVTITFDRLKTSDEIGRAHV